MGVACDDGAGLWALLHERSSTGPLATAGQPVPRAPWCASRLDIGIALEPSAAEWLADFARCIAWAWLDHRHGAS